MDFRIRTISVFVGSLPTTEAGWEVEIAAAAAFLKQAQALYEHKGKPKQLAPDYRSRVHHAC